MTSVRRSLAIVVVENQVIFALQFAMSIIIARLLTPKEMVCIRSRLLHFPRPTC